MGEVGRELELELAMVNYVWTTTGRASASGVRRAACPSLFPFPFPLCEWVCLGSSHGSPGRRQNARNE